MRIGSGNGEGGFLARRAENLSPQSKKGETSMTTQIDKSVKISIYLRGRDAELLDGIRAPFWPVWARLGNDNIISRIRVFGERLS